jgi:hypothetical protein
MFQEWWVLNVSSLRTGTILLPGTSMLTDIDIDNRLSKSESDCIIVDLQLAEKVERISAKHKQNLKFKIFVQSQYEHYDLKGNKLACFVYIRKYNLFYKRSSLTFVTSTDLKPDLTTLMNETTNLCGREVLPPS